MRPILNCKNYDHLNWDPWKKAVLNSKPEAISILLEYTHKDDLHASHVYATFTFATQLEKKEILTVLLSSEDMKDTFNPSNYVRTHLMGPLRMAALTGKLDMVLFLVNHELTKFTAQEKIEVFSEMDPVFLPGLAKKPKTASTEEALEAVSRKIGEIKFT